MSFMRQVWRILNLACEESARLTSESQDGPLPLGDRLALWGHLLVCTSCRRFRRQIQLLQDLASDLRQADTLPVSTKEQIKSALRKASGET